MADYKHTIATERNSEISVDTPVAQYGIQAVVGTAPINLLADPASAVNKPIVVRSRAEAKRYFGSSTDYKNYTLMQSVLASFQSFAVAPLVLINVLDPTNPAHVTAVAAEEFDVIKGKVVVEQEGILLANVTVANGDTEAVAGTDYVLSFNTDGYLVVTVTPDGALASVSKLNIGFKKLNPGGVTASDIVGGIDENNNRKGIELIDEIYPRLEIIPSILLAPGFSTNPAVAAALEAKAQINGNIINSVALVDIDATTVTNIANVPAAKDAAGLATRWVQPLWPMCKVNGNVISASAQYGAGLQELCAENGNIPSESADNKSARIQAACLADGTEVFFTQKQINNYLNANGISSFLYFGGWKFWGNNTAAFPNDDAPNNRFLKCVLMGNYLENRFKTEQLVHIGKSGSIKEMQSIVTTYNAALNALIPDVLAGAEIVFNKTENPMSEILKGRWTFHTRYADYVPTEYIDNRFTWDSSILENAINTMLGGNE
jgi:phage tail sheath protein FI